MCYVGETAETSATSDSWQLVGNFLVDFFTIQIFNGFLKFKICDLLEVVSRFHESRFHESKQTMNLKQF